MALHSIALCAGVAMLDEGCRLAFEHLGFPWRTCLYVEREIAAAAQLVTLMEAGCIDPAPIWDDLVTFDGRPWHGRVDCITAGFPCQPHSLAGKREGLDDARWIWPDIVRIIGEVGPLWVVLENGPGLVSTGGLAACLGDLAALGFAAEWGTLRASDVGASHQRERLFIVAHCDGDELRPDGGRSDTGADRRHDVAAGGRELADTRSPRHEGREFRGTRNTDGGGQEAHGSIAELCGPFAPGPGDERWPAIIERCPHLAPATEPGLRGVVDGLSLVVGESRTDQLRAIGNGVVPLQAAAAIVCLARRGGILADA